ncbi:hypothetical protein [Flavobacterium saccharophilum]|uniref:Activator of Hsp90 ATPase homolog 1-like protein n=1 Tax=Flavobacterium saccharophilum TaxID=29534 RepID=A0A1M7FSI6_9FLAO|nr:hypothetical protein [Flavobacterium saccharophilum]SHM06946.1 hypothetical protein SAMN05444366_2244 [Flavobacterium saccharophilum]
MRKELQSFIIVSAPLEEVFSYFFSLNPTVVLQNIWFVPKNEKNILNTDMIEPGDEELIYFQDGSTALYQLFSLIPRVSFSVHIDEFRSKRFKGFNAMRCHFTFTQLEHNKIIVDCRYQFYMDSSLRQLFFDLFLKGIIQKKLNADLALGADKLHVLV